MKHLKYLSYVVRHKWFVMVECFVRGLFWQGITHDMSKFLPSEWFPYVKYFYGAGYRTDTSTRFDMAWLHHQKRNKHHWQFWILHEDNGGLRVLYMPRKYMVEMVCDWIGAGRAKGKKPSKCDPLRETREWYKVNRARMRLHVSTRREVEKMIGYTHPPEDCC